MRKKTAAPASFPDFLQQWLAALPAVSFDSLLKQYPAEQTAVLSIDMVNGFCKKGNLSSPRVGAIVEPVVRLFRNAEQHGLNHYALLEDHHPENSKEFTVYPPHCVEGTEEAATIQELQELPHAYKFRVFPKNTINPGLEPAFVDWLKLNDSLRQFLVVGDCTDICVYQLALFLKLRSLSNNRADNVVVPADCVDTYDIPVEAFKEKAILPHPGDLLHSVFLYHMQQNGIQVVARIE